MNSTENLKEFIRNNLKKKFKQLVSNINIDNSIYIDTDINNNSLNSSYNNTLYFNNINKINYLENNSNNILNLTESYNKLSINKYFISIPKICNRITETKLKIYFNKDNTKTNIIYNLMKNFKFMLELNGSNLYSKNFYNIMIEYKDNIIFNDNDNFIEFNLFSNNIDIYRLQYSDIKIIIEFNNFINYEKFDCIYKYNNNCNYNGEYPNSKQLFFQFINYNNFDNYLNENSCGFILYFDELNYKPDITNIYLTDNKNNKNIYLKFQLIYIYNISFYIVFIDKQITNYTQFKNKFFSNNKINTLDILINYSYFNLLDLQDKYKINFDITNNDYKDKIKIINISPNILQIINNVGFLDFIK